MSAKPILLITGASGFIGSHLVELGIRRGYEVYALVRKTSSIENLSGIKLIYGDVTNYDSLLLAFAQLKREGVKLDYIIHAAALTKSNSKKEIQSVNYNGTFNLYTSLERLNYLPKKIAFISSLAACGPGKIGEPIEKGQSQPITTYGKSKLEAERFIQNSGNIPTVIIRPTAVYGEGEKDLLSVFKLVNRGFSPIMGFHHQDLTFIYVKDLSYFVYSALEKGIPNKIYFATDGHVYDKRAFSDTIAKSLGKKPVTIGIPLPIIKAISWVSQHGSALFGKASALSIEKYQELVAESWVCQHEDTYTELNYVPHYTLKKGVEETSAWYKKNKWIN